MTPLVRAELTKILTQRSVWIAVGILIGLQLLIGVQTLPLYADAVAAITPEGIIEVFPGLRQPAEEAMIESLVSSSLEMSLFLPVIAVILMGQELSHKQLRTSLLAVPARGRLLVAKLAAATLFFLVPVLLVVAVSALFAFLAVKDWNPGLLFAPEAVAGQLQFIGFALAACLASAGITLLLRNVVVSAVVVVAMAAVSYAQAAPAAIDPYLPVSAGRNLLLDTVTSTDLTSSAAVAVAVLVAWVLLTGVGSAVAVVRRDAP